MRKRFRGEVGRGSCPLIGPSSSLPVVKAAQDDPAFKGQNLKTFNSILADHAAPMPLIAQEGQMEQFIGAAVKGLVATAASKGTVSDAQVKAALSDANEKMAAAG